MQKRNTEIDLVLTWEPEGFVEKAGDLLNIDDATVSRDLKNFKEFIEERGSEEGAWRGEIH